MSPDDTLKPDSLFPSWASLLFFILIIAAARFHTYNEPVERDLSVYAVIGHGMLQGRPLYSDLWDHKPPAIDAAYALAEWIVGYGQQEFLFLGLLAAVLTLLGIYRVGSIFGGRKSGFWAAFFWTLLCSDMLLQANQPNTEVFDNLALVWALAFILPSPRNDPRPLVSGILLSVATLFKPQAVCFVFLFPAALFFFESPGKRLKSALRTFALLAFPVAAAWGAVCFHFLRAGHWKDFYGAVVLYNKSYAGSQTANLVMGLKPNFLFPHALWFLAVPLLWALLAFWVGRKERPKEWIFFLAYIVGIFYFVASAGRFRLHYYQLWVPVAALASGWAVALLASRARGPVQRLAWVPAAACLAAILYHEVPNYTLSAQRWSLLKYGNTFIECRELADSIPGILKPGETFFEFGNDPGLYFYSRKEDPTGVIYVTPAMEGPLASTLWKRYQEDLAAHPPQLLIVDNLAFTHYYEHFSDKFDLWRFFPMNGHYALMVATGGELEGRLRKAGALFPEGSGF